MTFAVPFVNFATTSIEKTKFGSNSYQAAVFCTNVGINPKTLRKVGDSGMNTQEKPLKPGPGGWRQWVKSRQHPLANVLYLIAMGLRNFEFPVVKLLHGSMYLIHKGITGLWSNFIRTVYWTPLFKTRLAQPAPRLYLYGGMPLLLGPLEIRLGSDCRVSGQVTVSGRGAGLQRPKLIVGNNVDISWQTTIAVGSEVRLGNNVRMAGQAFLAGYPGHPMDSIARAKGLPDTDDQIGAIILEDDVWLASRVTVMAGVRIGRGTVVAAGSVVTKDLPAAVLAGGVPARVIRPLALDGS